MLIADQVYSRRWYRSGRIAKAAALRRVWWNGRRRSVPTSGTSNHWSLPSTTSRHLHAVPTRHTRALSAQTP